MEVLRDFQNDLFNRREVRIVVEAEKNPSYVDATKILIDQFKGSEDVIVIDKIKGMFGRNTFLITGSIYKTKEDKEKTEPKSKKKEGEAKPAEQPVAEEKKEESPKAEEPKSEEKAS